MINTKIQHPKLFTLSLLFSFMIFHRLIGPIPDLSSTFIEFCLTITILATLYFYDLPRLYTPLLFFIIYVGLSLFIIDPPAVFRSGQRLFYFIGVIALVSPLMQSKTLRIFRRYCLVIISSFSVITSVLSFFGFFLGINYMVYEAIDLVDWTESAGLFSGLTKQSIVLGILSGISSCCILFYSIEKNWKFIFLLIPCMGSLILSVSRGAIFATIIGCITILYLAFRKSSMRKKIGRYIFIIICGLAIAFNFTNAADIIQSKNDERGENSILSSREVKYNYRIEEFKSSPIIGIGFGAIDINSGDIYNTETGVIEPGTSWLAILSMTGIIGLTFILYIFYSCIKSTIDKKRNLSYLLTGLIAFISISMFSEGYIFAAGSPLCVIAWLIIGECKDTDYTDNV